MFPLSFQSFHFSTHAFLRQLCDFEGRISAKCFAKRLKKLDKETEICTTTLQINSFIEWKYPSIPN